MSAFENEMRSMLKAGLYNWPVYEKSTILNYFLASSEDSYTLEIPMLGITRENLTVDVQDDKLTIIAKADTKVSTLAKDFKQSWYLAKDSNVEAVAAKLEHGVLSVTVPRVKPLKKVVNVAVA